LPWFACLQAIDLFIYVTALPPDVRRGLCPAGQLSLNRGLCPWSGLGPLRQSRERVGFHYVLLPHVKGEQSDGSLFSSLPRLTGPLHHSCNQAYGRGLGLARSM
jgi:hypothetical protein